MRTLCPQQLRYVPTSIPLPPCSDIFCRWCEHYACITCTSLLCTSVLTVPCCRRSQFSTPSVLAVTAIPLVSVAGIALAVARAVTPHGKRRLPLALPDPLVSRLWVPHWALGHVVHGWRRRHGERCSAASKVEGGWTWAHSVVGAARLLRGAQRGGQTGGRGCIKNLKERRVV